MRISDWSSDVCSSDLFPVVEGGEVQAQPLTRAMLQQQAEEVDAGPADKGVDAGVDTLTPDNPTAAEGRDDTDMGEGCNDDVPAWRGAGDAHLTWIKSAEFLPDGKLAISEYSASRDVMPEGVRGEGAAGREE